MSKVVSPAIMLAAVDQGVLEAVEETTKILRNPSSRNTEKLAAAKALINFKVTFMDMQRRNVFDKLEQRIKLAKAQMDEIRLSEVQAILNPNNVSGSKPQTATERAEVVSRVFDPSLRPTFVSDEVARLKEG